MSEEEDLGAPETLRPITFLAAVFWTGGTLLLTLFILGLTDAARPGATTDLVNVMACTVLAYSVLLFAMLRVYAPHARVRDVLGLRSASPVGCVLSAAAGLALYPGLDLIHGYLTRRFPLPPEDTEILAKMMQATSRGERVVLVGALVIGPVCDELFFRGALFRGLRRGRPEGLAVVATAFLSAISTGELREMPTAFIIGLLASWLRGRSGSLVPALLAHAAIAAVDIAPVAMGKGEPTFGPRLAVGGAIAAAVLTWGAGMLFARDGRGERGRLADA